MNRSKFRQLKEREFYGKIVKAYTGKLLGWYEVEIPQLLGKGNTIKARDESNKNLLDQNSGSYYPLLPGQNVIIKFSNDDINSAYIDRIANTIVYRMAPDKFGHYTYIVVQTPKDMKIHIDDQSEEVKVIHKGAYNFIFLKNEGAQFHSEKRMEIKSKETTQIHSMEQVEIKFGKPNTSSEEENSNFFEEIINNVDLSSAPYSKDIYFELKQSNGIVKEIEIRSKQDKRLTGETLSAIDDINNKFGAECSDQVSKECCVKVYDQLKRLEEIYNYYLNNVINKSDTVKGYYETTKKELVEYLAENCPDIVNNNWELPPEYYKYSEEYNKRLYKPKSTPISTQSPKSINDIEKQREQEIEKIKKDLKNSCACKENLLIPFKVFWAGVIDNDLIKTKTEKEWLSLIIRDINRIIYTIKNSGCCNRANVCPEFGNTLLEIANKMVQVMYNLTNSNSYQYQQTLNEIYKCDGSFLNIPYL